MTETEEKELRKWPVRALERAAKEAVSDWGIDGERTAREYIEEIERRENSGYTNTLYRDSSDLYWD